MSGIPTYSRIPAIYLGKRNSPGTPKLNIGQPQTTGVNITSKFFTVHGDDVSVHSTRPLAGAEVSVCALCLNNLHKDKGDSCHINCLDCFHTRCIRHYLSEQADCCPSCGKRVTDVYEIDEPKPPRYAYYAVN